LKLVVQYRADVFDAAVIEALVERLQRVLVTMSGDPAQPLSSIDLDERELFVEPQATPVSATEHPDNGVGYRAPATLVEQILAGIWAEVLAVDRVGVDESFFELGGDSLSAMRAIAAINTALNVHLAVPTLINAPSVRSLSQQLSNHAGPAEELPVIPTPES
jgi:non-ribosomal peptide synthetase component F